MDEKTKKEIERLLLEQVELDKKVHRVVDELVKTRQVELEPMETDPNWWALYLMFRKN